MQNWSQGYTTEIDYDYSYFKELNPTYMKYKLVSVGIVPPKVRTACELGFGQGLSLNIHNCMPEVKWHGTDFNPVQVAFAQELNQALDCTADLHDKSFDEFASITNLPQFDFIGIHGVWSWISNSSQKQILSFINQKLSPGGVVYMSYNCKAGNTGFDPIRDILMDFAFSQTTASESIEIKIEKALELLNNAVKAEPLYAVANPLLIEKIKQISVKSKKYLAHEYFNRDWNCVHFGNLWKRLQSVKLDFAASADETEHLDLINYSEKQLSYLSEITDRILKESLKDMMLNRGFRKDYWIKGLRKFSANEWQKVFGEFYFFVNQDPSSVDLKISGTQRTANLDYDFYNMLLKEIKYQRTFKLNDLWKKLNKNGLQDFRKLAQAIIILEKKTVLTVALDPSLLAKSKKATDSLNSKIIQKSEYSREIEILASPISVSGYKINWIHLQFVAAVKKRISVTNNGLARYVLNVLNSRGENLVIGGEAISEDDLKLETLIDLETKFIDEKLPELENLKII